MRIGIDYTALQGPHRYRGIGSVLLNVINSLSDKNKEKHQFVFFVKHGSANKKDLLKNIDLQNLDYRVVEFNRDAVKIKQLPGRLRIVNSVINSLIKHYRLRYGHSFIIDSELRNIDVYLQIDPNVPLPKKRHGLVTAVMLHDLIPYVLEADYLWNYSTARIHGLSRKASLRTMARRLLYAWNFKALIKHADILLANSEHTKQDFIKFLGVQPNRIKVTLLGIKKLKSDHVDTKPTAIYKETSWGYLKEPYEFDNTPFILYVGGADRRRKIEDIVMAFNRIRAKGIALKLVLSGDSMDGPMKISTEEIQHALKTSSYQSDIIYMGYTDSTTLNWLYKHATTFIFPSRYEGFGLPVLEAMNHGTPVIAYDNKAIREICKNIPIYVNNGLELEQSILKLLTINTDKRNLLIKRPIELVKSYDWRKTSDQIIDIITS